MSSVPAHGHGHTHRQACDTTCVCHYHVMLHLHHHAHSGWLEGYGLKVCAAYAAYAQHKCRSDPVYFEGGGFVAPWFGQVLIVVWAARCQPRPPFPHARTPPSHLRVASLDRCAGSAHHNRHPDGEEQREEAPSAPEHRPGDRAADATAGHINICLIDGRGDGCQRRPVSSPTSVFIYVLYTERVCRSAGCGVG